MLLMVALFLLPMARGQMEGDQAPQQPPPGDGLAQNELTSAPFDLLSGVPPLPPPPTLPPPNLDSPMSKRVMSSMSDLPSVITSQIQGNPNPLRKMISHMLGEGLLSKLITSPVQAAEEMGMPLEDLGFNKTEALKNLKSTLQESNITSFVDPDSIFGMKEGEDHSAASRRRNHPTVPSSTFAPPQRTTPVMYVEGKPVADFDNFIRTYHPKDKHGNPLFKPETTTQLQEETTTVDPERAALEEALRRSQHQSVLPGGFYEPSIAGTVPIGNDPIPRPLPVDISHSVDTNLIDPNRIREVNELLRRSPMRSNAAPYDRRPMTIDTLNAASLDPMNMPAAAYDSSINTVVNTLRTKSVSELSVSEIKDLQAALQNFEQTIKTKELLEKKRELQGLQEQLEMQKRELEDQRKREQELRLKQQHLMEERKKIENQLQKELHSFQSGFGLNTEETTTPLSLLGRDFEHRSLLADVLSPDPVTVPPEPIGPQVLGTFPRISTPSPFPPMGPRPTYPAEEETTTEAPPTREPLASMHGPMGMSMSILRKRPLPENLLAENDATREEEDVDYAETSTVKRAKENPFELVHYQPEEEQARGVNQAGVPTVERPEEIEHTVNVMRVTTTRAPELPVEEEKEHIDDAPRAGGGVRPVYTTPRRNPLRVVPTTTSPTDEVLDDVIEEPLNEEGEEQSERKPHIVDSEVPPPCECISIDMHKMAGAWVPALASPAAVTKIEEAVGVIFEEDPLSLSCAKIDFAIPKKSITAQDAKFLISFRTEMSETVEKLRGSALTLDRVSIMGQLKDFNGNRLSAPFCILKAEGEEHYEYMVAVSGNGSCKEAILLVRNPDTFFDNDNGELITYFKHKISRHELDPLEAVSFASSCD